MKAFVKFVVFYLLIIPNCYCQVDKGGNGICKKWSTYNGILVFEFKESGQFQIKTIDTSLIKIWKFNDNLINDSLIFIKDSASINFDTLKVYSLSEDSLIIDIAKPRGSSIGVFNIFKAPQIKIEAETVSDLIKSKKFKVNNFINKYTYNIEFMDNGQCSVDNKKGNWSVKYFEGFVYLIVEDERGLKGFWKVLNVSDLKIEFETYNFLMENYTVKLLLEVVN